MGYAFVQAYNKDLRKRQELNLQDAFQRSSDFKSGELTNAQHFQKIKKLPSQEEDSNPYFQRSYLACYLYTIQLSFLNEGAYRDLNPTLEIHNLPC